MMTEQEAERSTLFIDLPAARARQPCMNLISGIVAVLQKIRHRKFTESMR